MSKKNSTWGGFNEFSTEKMRKAFVSGMFIGIAIGIPIGLMLT
ncbi:MULTISPECIES: hypothetical protein [unclassified Pseudoalteromonas]|nr:MULTISPECIES: hypothetical protein [unclassified Pseudoalteromonas]